jgi:hypothetical protein
MLTLFPTSRPALIDFGFWIADFGLGEFERAPRQSKIRNPKSFPWLHLEHELPNFAAGRMADPLQQLLLHAGQHRKPSLFQHFHDQFGIAQRYRPARARNSISQHPIPRAIEAGNDPFAMKRRTSVQ